MAQLVENKVHRRVHNGIDVDVQEFVEWPRPGGQLSISPHAVVVKLNADVIARIQNVTDSENLELKFMLQRFDLIEVVVVWNQAQVNVVVEGPETGQECNRHIQHMVVRDEVNSAFVRAS